MRMDRRVASLLLVTGTLIGSAAVLAPAPAAAAAVPADPNTFANTVTNQQVVFTVGTTNANLYSVGPTVTMTGPGSGTDTYDGTNTTVDTTAGTVTTTFDLVTASLPAGPGTYAVSLKALGLPVDTSSITVTYTQPTVAGSAGVAPGGTAPITITATNGTFARGDQVTIAPDTGSGGVTITGVAVGATTITGTLHAAADAGIGSYSVVITDTAGHSTTCTDCVTIAAPPHAVTGLMASNITPHAATLSWTAASDGNPATGYQIVVSTSSTKTTTDSGITVTHSGTSTTATVTGLKQATRYYATVTPTGAGGPGPSTPPTPFYTAEPSFLTFSHTKPNITYGTSLTLSGNLSTTGDAPLALQHVKLYSKTGAAGAVLIKTVTTTADGNYRYTFKPKYKATYIAFYPGVAGTSSSPPIGASIGKPFNSTVAQRISLAGSTKHHGRWLVLSGKVAPDETGRTVVIYKRAHGHTTKFASTKVRSGSTYKIIRKHLKSGRYKLFATIKATALNAAGKSQKLTVNRP